MEFSPGLASAGAGLLSSGLITDRACRTVARAVAHEVDNDSLIRLPRIWGSILWYRPKEKMVADSGLGSGSRAGAPPRRRRRRLALQ